MNNSSDNNYIQSCSNIKSHTNIKDIDNVIWCDLEKQARLESFQPDKFHKYVYDNIMETYKRRYNSIKTVLKKKINNDPIIINIDFINNFKSLFSSDHKSCICRNFLKNNTIFKLQEILDEKKQLNQMENIRIQNKSH